MTSASSVDMLNEIRYSDPKKQEKLEEAIRRGFVIRHFDGKIVTYELTIMGQVQWQSEEFFRGFAKRG